MTRIALLSLTLAAACTPAYFDTVAPEDAKFEVGCAGPCGGGQKSIAIDVSFAGKNSRKLTLCCNDKEELRSRLATARDFFCDGLEVAPRTVGGITIGTTVSDLTGKRAVTLDQGEGYVSFQCDDWLPKLVTALEQTTCCER